MDLMALTVEELDAMGVGQIVLDRDGDKWRKLPDQTWQQEGSESVRGAPATDAARWELRRRETHVEQPMPTASTGPSMHDLAIQVHGERARTGLERYGQPLRAMNGRDAVRDTIEELADGLAYALQIREERRLLRAELDLLADKCVDADPFACTELRDIITRYFPEES